MGLERFLTVSGFLNPRQDSGKRRPLMQTLNMDFKHKTVWITGASSGIGEALAYALSFRGANLILSGRRTDELERVQMSCKYPDQVKILPLDLSDASSLGSKTAEAI